MKREAKEKICANNDCDRTFMQFKSTVKVCSVDCAISFAKQKSLQDSVKVARRQKKEWYDNNQTVQVLANKVQVSFNTFIRQRDAGKDCISCFKPLKGKFDAGHYHNANNHWSVRFNELNVHGQCVKCNRDEHANLINYRIGLLERIGKDALANLDSIANETRKFTRNELREIEKKYKAKII